MDRETARSAVFVENLWRTYGRERILRGVNLNVPHGGGIAVLGANGSGKTTLLRCLAAVLRPTRGTVRIDGLDPWADPEVRRKIGFVTHEPMLYGGLSIRENLRLFASLYGLRDGRTRVEALCDRLGLARRNDPIRLLSRGMQQRAAVARAILHNPTVLILDEALGSLDLEAAQALSEFLQAFRQQGGTVVLSTHNPVDALRVGDWAYVLAGGRLSGPLSLDGLGADTVADWYRATVSQVAP